MTKEQEALVLENMRLAYYIARRQYYDCGIELEDVEAIALLGLVKASLAFGPEKGCKFSAYAGAVINTEILQVLRKRRRHEGRGSMASLQERIGQNTYLADIIADRCDRHKQVEDVLFLSQLMQSGVFSDRDRLIFKLVFVDGYGQVKAGELAGVSQPYVSAVLKRAKSRAHQWAAMEIG